MKQFRADFDVKAAAVLDESAPELRVADRAAGYEIRLWNAGPDPEGHIPRLVASVIGRAATIENVANAFRDVLAACLDVLSFATHMKFHIVQCTMVMQWEPNQKIIDARFLRKFETSDPPSPDLPRECEKLTQMVIDAATEDYIRKALQWFRYGLIGEQSEEQIQYFWRSIETIAEGAKDRTKAPISCPKCGNGLFCCYCQEIPHRVPMAQQEIRGWIDKFAGERSREFHRILSAARNHITHGGSKETFERKVGASMEDVVNMAGALAWHMIHAALGLDQTVAFFRADSDYVTRSLIMTVNVQFEHTGPGKYPEESMIPRPTISMITHFRDTAGD